MSNWVEEYIKLQGSSVFGVDYVELCEALTDHDWGEDAVSSFLKERGYKYLCTQGSNLDGSKSESIFELEGRIWAMPYLYSSYSGYEFYDSLERIREVTPKTKEITYYD